MRCDVGRVGSDIVCQALSGNEVTFYGEGTQTRSFCYATDLLEGLIRLIESDSAVGMPVNLGNPNELTVKRLVEVVLAMTGSNSPVVHRPLPVDDPRRRKPDIRRAMELLDWNPVVDLEQGLEATIAWFKDGANRVARPMYVDAPAMAAAE